MSLKFFQKNPTVIATISTKVKFPQKFKGTIIEKWADYWKNFFIDYRQMLQDLRTDVQDEPVKALKWVTCLGLGVALAKSNPNELDFKHDLNNNWNQIVLVSQDCQNAKTLEHLRIITSSYNEERIHYKSFGIASVMYLSDLNYSCDLYKNQCSYLQPSYFSFVSRIIDVGIMGRWWNMFIKTSNYDVNDEVAVK